MTKIVSVTTMLEAKGTRHKKGKICVSFKGDIPSDFVNQFKIRFS